MNRPFQAPSDNSRWGLLTLWFPQSVAANYTTYPTPISSTNLPRRYRPEYISCKPHNIEVDYPILDEPNLLYEGNKVMNIKRKLRNISRNGPSYAIIFFALIVGAIMVVPTYLFLSYVLRDQLSATDDPWALRQKIRIASIGLNLIVAPCMASRTRTEQFLNLRKKTVKKPQPQAAAASVKEAPPQKSVEPPVQKPVQKQEPAHPQETTQVQAPAPTVTPAQPQGPVITFDDIAGYAETKKNMEFIVKCLRNPELLRQVGAKIPAGILLYGPPGTGKTLMAKAIAGTAGVNFYSANASEFVQVWVGQGALNVRALYQAAKANAPSIVFIDELDAIGGTRTSGQNQEYRQTLNALLTEMDGIGKDSGVLTIAATNAFEDLDPALVRPGRFDRKIMIPLPNVADRLAIIKLYAARRNMAPGISLEKLARETVGMSGSAIATMFNEASIRAVMADRGVIIETDLDGALTQMLTNGEAAKATNPEDLKIAAYHEAGHAVIMRLLAKDPVQKVSIIGSTIGAVGMTFRSDNEDRLLVPVEVIRARIIAAYGGRAAEELVFGKENITVGARQDIKDASAYIREYLDCGAGGALLHEETFAGGRVSPDINTAKNISKALYEEAVKFLGEHRDSLERVAQALLDKETIMEEELEALL